jgi:hypothetical protein
MTLQAPGGAAGRARHGNRHHASINTAIRNLRKVRQARNIIQHGIATDGGLTAKLRQIGIHDAPPNWEGAWNAIRAQTADAMSAIRNELRSALDDAYDVVRD